MKFISLIDTRNLNIITIDASNYILKIEIDGNIKEIRLKLYMVAILYKLFIKHPKFLSYQEIISILKEHKLIISDTTRMHRKLSEIRSFISIFHPGLEEILLNIRNIGYTIPLYLKNISNTKTNINFTEFKNLKIGKSLEIIYHLIDISINITSNTDIIKYDQVYISNSKLLKNIIAENILIFNQCVNVIFQELRTHEADFNMLRVNYLFAKFKTYIGLARISEYPISEKEWLNWFEQEIWFLFNEIKKMIKYIENSEKRL